MSAQNSTPTPIVVVFPRGQLTDVDKTRMQDFGVLAVEADSPNAVVQLHLAPPLICTEISGDALVAAALHAIASAPSTDRSEAARTALRFIEHLNTALAKPAKDQP